MNIDIMLALLNQAANYISLVGSYLAQTAAEIAAEKHISPLMNEIADNYNVLGNQLTTIGLTVYCIQGQIAIAQVIADANVINTSTSSVNTEEGTSSLTEIIDEPVGSSRVWHVKKVKKLQRRRWRTIQHQK